jgi:hypothetical protein
MPATLTNLLRGGKLRAAGDSGGGEDEGGVGGWERFDRVDSFRSRARLVGYSFLNMDFAGFGPETPTASPTRPPGVGGRAVPRAALRLPWATCLSPRWGCKAPAGRMAFQYGIGRSGPVGSAARICEFAGAMAQEKVSKGTFVTRRTRRRCLRPPSRGSRRRPERHRCLD